MIQEINNLLLAKRTNNEELIELSEKSVLVEAKKLRKSLSKEECELFDKLVQSIHDDKFVRFMTDNPMVFVELRNMTNNNISNYMKAITRESVKKRFKK